MFPSTELNKGLRFYKFINYKLDLVHGQRYQQLQHESWWGWGRKRKERRKEERE